MTTDLSGVLGEVRQRLADMTGAARARGGQVMPPLLILGTSERVGSNWVSDTLRPAAAQHNEPFRQQIGADHPWSALNPRPAGVGFSPEADMLGRQWLVTFAVSKYAPARQVVKETSLFFALPALLALLPGAPVLVLSRAPLGVASSFTRGDLFRRWRYRERYQQMVTMTRCGTGSHRRFAVLVPDDDPPDLVALARLQVLNTALIAAALAAREPAHVAYETMITRPAATAAALTAAVPDLAAVTFTGEHAAHPRGQRPCGDDTFATTTSKTDLTASLKPCDAALVSATTTASIAAVRALLPGAQADQVQSWLAGNHLYRLEQPRKRHAPAAGAVPATPPATSRFVRHGDLEVRNTLVTNIEFAGFMNALAAAGMCNGHGGTWLLACEMPHERGGRLHYDPAAGQWQVSPGFEDHPAYWVTWIGAAAFAAWASARLPARTELLRLTQDAALTGNAGYRHGDVTPVTEPGVPPGGIHHLLGNVQVWCGDGPGDAEMVGGPAGRWLYGIAWNTPATRQAAQQPRSRHILGCSRSVGIRLVRDRTARRPVPATGLAARLAAWISSLDDRSQTLSEIDQQLISAVDGSQADVRFSAHVAAGAGESRHG
ncbi:MAG: SUMF1/EgtB/PvdO family nonheme iron enzyme [Streptosporangiaceae bacterium]